MKGNNALLWIFSIIFTLAIAYYQRATGPTYEKKGKVVLDGTMINYKLIRSAESDEDAAVKIRNSVMLGS